MTNNSMSMNDRIDSEHIYFAKISSKRRKIGEFIARNSLLTDLFQVPHIKFIHNACIAGFFLIILRHTIYDLLHYGR